MAIMKQQLLDFADPGPLDESITQVPGFIDEVKDWTLKTAHSPNPTLAFMGALGLLAHLSGRSHADTHGTRTNLYLVALGETGIGKEAPRQTSHRVLDAIGWSRSVLDTAASGQGLEDRLVESPSLLLQADETEVMFRQMRTESRMGEAMSERFRRLYTASQGKYVTRAKANESASTLENPHLTFFGTGTPDAFYDTLNGRMIENGMYGRCLVLQAEDRYVSQLPELCPLPDNVLKWAKCLYEREMAFSGGLTLVRETPEATARRLELNAEAMAERRELDSHNLAYARALLVRMPEKIAKLTLLGAISRNPEKPLIETCDVDWATRFVTHVSASMLHEAQFHVSEGKFDRLVKRFIGMLDKAGGSLDRSTMLKNLHVDSQTFTRITLTLHMSDMIEEEWLDGRKVVFTLKNAA
jgi:hypothetical protein